LIWSPDPMVKPPWGTPLDPEHPLGAMAGCWVLSEGGGTIAGDASGNRTNGTLRGATTWGPGPRGHAVTGNGASGSDVLIGNPACLQLSRGTIAARLKTSSPGASFRGIAVKNNAYGLFLVGSVLSAFDWGGGGGQRSTGVNLADGLWHLVAMSFDSGVASGTTIYLDGALVLTTTITVSSQTTGMTLLNGGSSITGQELAGSIDDARVFPRLLSAEEHRALVRAPYAMFPAGENRRALNARTTTFRRTLYSRAGSRGVA
jgi:hypothetical protein